MTIASRMGLVGVGVLALVGCTGAQQQGRAAQGGGGLQTRVLQDAVWGMPAATATMPAGWKFDGFAVHGASCISEGPGLRWAAGSPDGAVDMQMYPTVAYYASQNAQTNRQQQQAGCLVTQYFAAKDFLAQVVAPQLRPGAKVEIQLAQEIPPLYRNEVQQMQQMDQNAMQQGMWQHTDMAQGVLKLDFMRGNTPMTEVFTGFFVCVQNRYPSMGAAVRCTIENPLTITAPADKLQASFGSGPKVRLDAAWDKRGADEAAQQGQQALAATNARNSAMLKAQVDRGNQLMANQKAQYDAGVARNKAQNDGMHQSMQNSINAVGDQNVYTNGQTGQTYKASNQYSHTYVDSSGRTMLQTNSAYSPGPDTMWTELQPR